MEVIENGGWRLFMESGRLAKGMEWETLAPSGYWMGMLLQGHLEVRQQVVGHGSWRSGDRLMYASRSEIETHHLATRTGALTAVFVHVDEREAPKILGEEVADGFGPERWDYREIVHSIGWQIIGCKLSGPARNLYLSGKALELAAHMIDSRKAEVPYRPEYSARDIEVFHEAREILTKELADPPSITDLARRLGTNATKLGRGSRDLFGTSPYAFSKDFRLSQAKYLFEAGERSVTHVAAKLGYQPRHLTTEFRRKFGLTPREIFRKS